MTEIAERRRTLEDLHRHDGRAELIGGRLVELPMTGRRAAILAEAIYLSLLAHIRRVAVGEAHADGLDYTVPILSSGRESFRPDASFYTGPLPDDPDDFIPGPPDFAVEVRSKNDYGPAAESAMAAKRADYFEAGTKVVWDVDPVAATVTAFRADAPDRPRVFRRDDIADAEPAVPGWRMGVEEIFGGT
jgi:Uma2 family endonuclease